MNQFTFVQAPVGSLSRPYYVHRPSGLLVYPATSLADVMACRGVLWTHNSVADNAPWAVAAGLAFADQVLSRNPATLADVIIAMTTSITGSGGQLDTADDLRNNYVASTVAPVVPSTPIGTLYCVPHAAYSMVGSSSKTLLGVASGTTFKQILMGIGSSEFTDGGGVSTAWKGSLTVTGLIPTTNTTASILASFVNTWASQGLSSANVTALRTTIGNWLAGKVAPNVLLPYPAHLVSRVGAATIQTDVQRAKLLLEDWYAASMTGSQNDPGLTGNPGTMKYTTATISTAQLLAGRLALTATGAGGFPAGRFYAHVPILDGAVDNTLTTDFSGHMAMSSAGGKVKASTLLRDVPVSIAGIPTVKIFGHQPFGTFYDLSKTAITLADAVSEAEFLAIVRRAGSKSYGDYQVSGATLESLGSIQTLDVKSYRTGNSFNDTLVLNPHSVIRAIIEGLEIVGSSASFNVSKAEVAWGSPV